MTEQLIRKDVRLLRPVLWTAALLGLFFYVVLPTVLALDWRRDQLKSAAAIAGTLHRPVYPPTAADTVREAARQLAVASVPLWFAITLLATTTAGMAFAVERRERWGEFTVMLPVSRARAVAAKALASLGVVAGLFLVNGLVFLLACTVAKLSGRSFGVDGVGEIKQSIAYYLAVTTGMVGVAWLMSALMSSAVIATSTSLGLALSVLFVWVLVREQFDIRTQHEYAILLDTGMTGAFLIGLVCLAAGTVIQLRRQSP